MIKKVVVKRKLHDRRNAAHIDLPSKRTIGRPKDLVDIKMLEPND